MKNDAFGRTPDEMEDEARHREPRCRICRDESVRVLVNELLDWHGAPIILGRGKSNDQNLWMALGLVTWTGAPSRG